MKDRTVARAFGAVLREARTARGLSQEALAAEAEVSRTYPSLLERGHRVPTLCVFLRLAMALHLAPAELVNATLTRLAHAQPLPAALRFHTTDLAATPLRLARPTPNVADPTTGGRRP